MVLRSGGAHAADTRVIPYVRTITTSFAQPEGVGVGSGADFVNEDKFMLGSIESPHPTFGLVPDAQLLLLGEGRCAGVLECDHSPPIHDHVDQAAIAAH